jgi:hypothetical protein
MELGSWQVRTLFTQGTLLSFERQVSIKKRTVREPERRNKSWRKTKSKISQHNFNKPKVQTPQAHVYVTVQLVQVDIPCINSDKSTVEENHNQTVLAKFVHNACKSAQLPTGT